MISAPLAPPGAFCAVHADVSAPTVCARCGAFMCARCSLNNQESMCLACRTAFGFDVKVLAKAYRSLVLWFGVHFVLSGVNAVMPGPVKTLAGLGIFVTLIALTIYPYRTAKALGSNVAWLWAVLMFIPCANVITLLTLGSRAMTACNKHGIKVGFLGPKLEHPSA